MFCELPTCVPRASPSPVKDICDRLHVPDDSVQFGAFRIVLAVVNPTFWLLTLVKSVVAGTVTGSQVIVPSPLGVQTGVKVKELGRVCFACGMISFMRAWCPLKMI